MAPLGLFVTTVGAIGGPGMMGDPGGGAVIVDYFWEITTHGAGNLTPVPVTSDFNSMWDLNGTDYEPADDGSYVSEGYWETGPGSSEMQPLDV
tara:strand:- start:2488 stop:2766 length:279 start_codon:yes stop_codon:yes gene_type:complete